VFIMRRISLALFLVFTLMGLATQAGAQDLKCPNFSSDQDAAQAYFVAGGGSATNNYNDMDADGNGIACDEPGAFEGGGPSAGPENSPSAHPTECSEFPDQASAQAFLDVKPQVYSDLQKLDIDGNGIACDEPGTFGSSGPSSGSASDDDSDSSNSTKGDSDESDAVTVALPSTGSGSMGESSSMAVALAGAAAALLAGVAMGIRRKTAGSA
jgi:hypothetical protein